MIVHSISVSGWRSFLDEVSVGPFSEGLNVIHAPNGTGKSTLFEAMCRGLLDAHSVTGRDIMDIQPWGRGLSPTVRIEFSRDGTAYRLSKRFVNEAYARLERIENGAYRLFHENRQADDFVREMLTKNPPGRGLSRAENWGLAQVLWAPQGDLALSNLSGDLVGDIRQALGAQVSGASGGPIEKRIEELYLQYYTPKGNLKGGAGAPEVVHLETRLEAAKAQRAEAWERYLAHDEKSRKIQDIRARREQTRRETGELSKTLRTARERAETYRKLQNDLERKREAKKTAEAQYERLKQHVKVIQDTDAELERAREERKALTDQGSSLGRELEAREKELAQAKAAVENVQQAKAKVDEAVQTAEQARHYANGLERLERLAQRIEKIETAEHKLHAAQDARNEVIAPDKKTLKALRKAIAKRDEARTLINASLITLEIVPENPGHAVVITGEHPGPVDLAAGIPTRLTGAPEVVTDFEGVGRLRASGPAGDIEAHREDLAEAQRQIGELTQPYGTADLTALEELADKANALDSGVTEAKTTLETLLGDETLEALKQERNIQQATLEKLRESHPEWRERPPDPHQIEAEAAEVKRGFEERLAGAEEAHTKAHAAWSEANTQAQVHQSRLQQAQRQADQVEEKFTELLKDGKSAEERAKELEGLLMQWDAARATEKRIQEELADYTDDPVAECERLERQLSALDKTAQEAREAEITAETELASLAAQGPYSAYTQAEEEVARLEDAVARERVRVESIKLLRDTLDQCRREAVEAVAKPVEETATRYLQRIAGRRLGSIHFQQDFTPKEVMPEAMEAMVELGNLSGGEKEQLYLATRLALAEVLAKDQRQLVVLDDVLTATDSGRLARIMGILEEAAQRVQLLALTCHPERYRGLDGAAFFDLEALVQSAAAGR